MQHAGGGCDTDVCLDRFLLGLLLSRLSPIPVNAHIRLDPQTGVETPGLLRTSLTTAINLTYRPCSRWSIHVDPQKQVHLFGCRCKWLAASAIRGRAKIDRCTPSSAATANHARQALVHTHPASPPRN